VPVLDWGTSEGLLVRDEGPEPPGDSIPSIVVGGLPSSAWGPLPNKGGARVSPELVFELGETEEEFSSSTLSISNASLDVG